MPDVYSLLLKDARLRVETFDKIDGHTVADGNIDPALRTVMTALKSAIVSKDWGVVAEAQVMLQQIELHHRPNKAGGMYLAEERKAVRVEAKFAEARPLTEEELEAREKFGV